MQRRPGSFTIPCRKGKRKNTAVQQLVPALVANLSAQTLWVKSTLADANNHRHFLLKLRLCRMRNTSPGVPFRKRLVPFKFPFESENFFLESWTQSPLFLFPLPLDLPFAAAAPEVGFPRCRSQEEKVLLTNFLLQSNTPPSVRKSGVVPRFTFFEQYLECTETAMFSCSDC